MSAPDIAVERLGADYFADPYSVHARLRAQRPVTPVVMPGGPGAWLITGYAEARAALADPRLSKHMPGWHPEPDSIFAALDLHMLNSDPPDHERLRKLVNKAFTARRVERLRPRITAITAGLLDRRPAGRRGEGRGPARDGPAGVVRVPAADHGDLRALGVPPATGTTSAPGRPPSLANAAAPRCVQAHATAHDPLFAGRCWRPSGASQADDLLSALIAARDEADSLSENELVSMAFLLLVAGHETTVNLIASGVLALLLNPAELAAAARGPALIGSAVEELLRYVNPVNHTTFRCAAEPVEIGGVRISRGDPVLVALSGANRDPARFGDPDRLDLGRDSSGHVAFGHGIHYCLGAPLARLEAEIAISGLLARFGSIRLAVPAASLRWRPSTLIHGLESLPVRLAP